MSNGVVGSPAFAAYDQGSYFEHFHLILHCYILFTHNVNTFCTCLLSGYDVFLGNLRGLVSREHVDKNLSSRM